MTQLKSLAAGAILFAGLAALLIWQQHKLRQVQADNARLLAYVAEVDSLREEISRLRQTQADPAELDRMRKAQSELLRLRGEAAQRRQQLNAQQPIQPTAPAKETPLASTPAEEAAAPVETFRAVVHASLASKQTLVTGGWTLPSGTRGVVLLEPTILSDADQPGQVVIQAHFADLSDAVLSKLGLEALRSEGKESSAHAILTSEQAEAVMNALKEAAGTDVLSAPKISTLNGRQAQVKVGNVRTINGVTFEVGPSVDVVPRISADGASVELSVLAQLRIQTPDSR